ncbi:hypothetical protein FCV25MIE_02151 [Fagus crenata]
MAALTSATMFRSQRRELITRGSRSGFCCLGKKFRGTPPCSGCPQRGGNAANDCPCSGYLLVLAAMAFNEGVHAHGVGPCDWLGLTD